jgi:hypothetical protein
VTVPPGVPVQPAPPSGYPPAATGYWTNPQVPGRPLPPGFNQTRWKGPQRPADLYALLGVLLGGLSFALALPIDRPGIGWPIAGLAAAVGVGYAARRNDVELSTADRVMRAAWGLAAIALLSLSAVRSSGLLTFFCVVAALACASLAAAGGHSVRGMLFGAIAAPLAGLRSIPWIMRGLAAVAAARDEGRAARARAAGAPGPDAATTGSGEAAQIANAAKTGDRRSGNRALSVIITLILLLVFGALFASADAVFAHYLSAAFSRIGDSFPDLNGPQLILRLFLLTVGLLITAGGIFLATAPPNLSGMENPGKPVLGRDFLILPLGGMVVLFLGFVAVQFTALFGGNRYVLQHSQVSYSRYAVGGFNQLVFVSILTLIIIGAVARWAHKETPADRLALRVQLGALCGLSIVIVISALTRLQLYVDIYGMTRERFAVAMLELFLAAMFALVLLAGWQMRASWLPRAILGVGVLMLLGAGLVNPERYIAQHNIDRYQAGEKIDLYYLAALTADAVPALVNLPEDERNCVLGSMRRELNQDPDQWYEWNFARERGLRILAEKFPKGFPACTGRQRYDYPSR